MTKTAAKRTKKSSSGGKIITAALIKRCKVIFSKEHCRIVLSA